MGVIELIFEFLISLVVIVGGGFLIYKGVASELAASSIGAVIVYWFTGRQVSKAAQIQTQQQQALFPQPEPPTNDLQQ